jgi:uncharacterized protein (DUF305 family)
VTFTRARAAVALLVAVCGGASCRSAQQPEPAAPIVQPGAPGAPARLITAEQAVERPAVRHTDADVRFMQGMIAHHAQALDMTALLETRTASEVVRKLGQRIEISQADEIELMKTWLARHGAAAPDPHAHHAHGAIRMPGMLTADEMRRLGEASGPEFDRLFLELMIRHHEGALVMVRELFAQPGAGQEPDIFAFASDVEADQRMEIARMGAMLRERTR